MYRWWTVAKGHKWASCCPPSHQAGAFYGWGVASDRPFIASWRIMPHRTPKTHRKTLPPHLVPGNPGNSGGKKGRSGRVPFALREHCHGFIRDVARDIIDTFLREGSPKTASWRWAFEQYCQLGGCYAPERHEHSGEVEVNVQDARTEFRSRMDRLASRLGAAGMPEWPER